MDHACQSQSVLLKVALLTILWVCCSQLWLSTEATPLGGIGRYHPHRHHLRHQGTGGGSSSTNRLTRHRSRPSQVTESPAELDLNSDLQELRQTRRGSQHHVDETVRDSREEFDSHLAEYLRLSEDGQENLDSYEFVDDSRELEGDAAVFPKVGCKNCAQRKAEAERGLTAEEIKEIRIEDIKRRILRKLRMKARPNVTIPRNFLPAPLSDGEVSLKGLGQHLVTKDIDDYYGKTEQIIVFPEKNHSRCFGPYHHSSACLYFSLASDTPEGEIASAELWVYKLKDRRDVLNQSFSVADLPPDNHSILKKRNFVALRETSLKTGWIKFNVKQAIKRWLLRPHAIHGLEVICRTCGREFHELPISDEPGERPFLVLTTSAANGEDNRRTKRNANCGAGSSQCCKEQFFVSFQDIGWDDWIIQPKGYTANYCRGSCVEDVTLPLSNSHHVTVMQRYIQKRTPGATLKEQLTPCCTPTRMSAISLLYTSEGRVLHKNLPNMVVDACGCS